MTCTGLVLIVSLALLLYARRLYRVEVEAKRREWGSAD